MVRTAPVNSRTRAMNPDRLTKFLDYQPVGAMSSFAGNSTRGGSVRPHTVYDPSLSWDGLSVDPKPFAKLDMNPKMTGFGGIGLAGCRVVEMDNSLPAGIFENVVKPGHGLPIVPTTVEQKDCRLDASDAPDKIVAVDPDERMLTYTDQKFMNGRVADAKIGVVKKPDVMTTAVEPVVGGYGRLKQFLLTPAEREEIMRAEARAFRAAGTIKKAELQRRRLVHLMRDRHPQGAMRVDGVENAKSAIYGDRAMARLTKENARAAAIARRRERIEDITVASKRLGYDPFGHNEEWLPQTGAAAAPATQFMQTKKRRPPPEPTAHDPQADSHDRLFGSEPAKLNPTRTQHLRNEDLGGKQYNAVHGCQKYKHWPATNPERKHDQSFMSHPSQVSLELPRSLQGAVPLGDRTTGMVIF